MAAREWDTLVVDPSLRVSAACSRQQSGYFKAATACAACLGLIEIGASHAGKLNCTGLSGSACAVQGPLEPRQHMYRSAIPPTLPRQHQPAAAVSTTFSMNFIQPHAGSLWALVAWPSPKGWQPILLVGSTMTISKELMSAPRAAQFFFSAHTSSALVRSTLSMSAISLAMTAASLGVSAARQCSNTS